MSSTYVTRSRVLIGCGCDVECLLRWWLMVALSKKGLDETPKTTRVNLNTVTSGCFLAISSYQRNRKASRSFSLIDTIKQAFSMSAVRQLCVFWTSEECPISFGQNFSPVCKQLFRELRPFCVPNYAPSPPSSSMKYVIQFFSFFSRHTKQEKLSSNSRSIAIV